MLGWALVESKALADNEQGQNDQGHGSGEQSPAPTTAASTPPTTTGSTVPPDSSGHSVSGYIVGAQPGCGTATGTNKTDAGCMPCGGNAMSSCTYVSACPKVFAQCSSGNSKAIQQAFRLSAPGDTL